MKRILSRLAMTTAVAVSLGVAGQSFAGGDIDCTVMKAGVASHTMVSSQEECAKLGGKIADAKAAAKSAVPKAPAVPDKPAMPKAPAKPSVPNPLGD